MFSARNIILAAIGVTVISILAGVLQLRQPPDSKGLGRDSFGTRAEGYRSVLELLEAFDVPVERRLQPFSPDMELNRTVLLWMPHHNLVATEPQYLQHLLDWVERGGRLVVAPIPPGMDEIVRSILTSGDFARTNLWKELKLDDLQLHEADVDANGSPQVQIAGEESPPEEQAETDREVRWDHIREGVQDALWIKPPVERVTVSVTGSGTLSLQPARVSQLEVSDKPRRYLVTKGSEKPVGAIEYQWPEASVKMLACALSRGQGEIVVVADPSLLSNSTLAAADNAVLAYDLLAAGGRTVVFDEFYHGLSVRGNALWLLTRPSYAVLALASLAALGLVVWRRAIWLGPPLETPTRSRRTIVEYVEAMSRLLHRTRRSELYLLQEFRDGVLRQLSHHYRLSSTAHDPTVVAAALARHSPDVAQKLLDAVHRIEAMSPAQRVPDSEVTSILAGLGQCLGALSAAPTAHKPTHTNRPNLPNPPEVHVGVN